MRVTTVLAVCAAVIVGIACGGDAGPAVPAGPFTGATGAALYAEACAVCHGADLGGTDQGPPFLDRTYEPGHHGDASFFAAARAGVRAHHWNFGAMPPIEGISEEQVALIVAFVRERQRAAGID